MISYNNFHYIGASHKFCQDFTLSVPGLQQVRVSDGCSESELSCVGARLTCLTNNDCERLSEIKNMLDFEESLFYATYLKLFYSGNYIYADIYGDGFFIEYDIETKKIFWIQVSYKENAPKYPSYTWLGNLNNWTNQFKNNNLITKINGEIISDEKPPLNLVDTFTRDFLKNKVYLISTDGLDSIYDKDKKQVEIKKVLETLFSISNYSGCFVERMLNKFRKECNKLGWINMDDVGIAGISNT